MLADLLQRKGLTVIRATPYRDAADYLENFMTFGTSLSSNGETETIASYADTIGTAYAQCGPVFACILARAMPFSEARFQFQQLVGGRPGRLFGTPDLALLENPWTNATTGELLWRMEQDASLAGNFYATVVGTGANRRLRRLRPDWVTVLSGVRDKPEMSSFDLNSEVLGYMYAPSGTNAPDPVLLSPDVVVHYSPIPDPDAQWRGMSWISPIVNEILGDRYATRHKLKFFENGATSNMVVTYDGSRSLDDVRKFKDLFDESHRGVDHAYKAIHLGGGADIKVLGADLQQLDFKATQGAGETRIAAAAGVGAIMARFSEGLQGSSLNAGNYGAAKRQFADMTLRPLWRTAAASLSKASVVAVPGGSRLWVDARDVDFLKDDRKDAAEIRSISAQTIKALVDAGYAPDSVVDAVEADDLSRLIGKHTGLYSVQLQAPGAMTPPMPPKQLELELSTKEQA